MPELTPQDAARALKAVFGDGVRLRLEPAWLTAACIDMDAPEPRRYEPPFIDPREWAMRNGL